MSPFTFWGYLIIRVFPNAYKSRLQETTELLLATARVSGSVTNTEKETIALLLSLQAPWGLKSAAYRLASETIKAELECNHQKQPFEVMNRFVSRQQLEGPQLASLFWSMLHVAYADNRFDLQEQYFVEALQRKFNFPVPDLIKLHETVVLQRHARGLEDEAEIEKTQETRAASVEEQAYDKALAVLMCNPDADLSEIKSRYRFLCKVYHPDTGLAATKKERDYRTARFRQIQSAFSTVCQYQAH